MRDDLAILHLGRPACLRGFVDLIEGAVPIPLARGFVFASGGFMSLTPGKR